MFLGRSWGCVEKGSLSPIPSHEHLFPDHSLPLHCHVPLLPYLHPAFSADKEQGSSSSPASQTERERNKLAASPKWSQMCSCKGKPSFFIGLHLNREASSSVLAKRGKLRFMWKPDWEPSRLHLAAGMEPLHMSTAEETDGERGADRWMGTSQGAEQLLKGQVCLLCQLHRNYRHQNIHNAMYSSRFGFFSRGWRYPSCQLLMQLMSQTLFLGNSLFLTFPVQKI